MTWTVRQKLFAFSFTFLALFLLLGVAATTGETQGFDEWKMTMVHHFSSPFLDTFFQNVTLLGGTIVVTVATASTMLWLWIKDQYFKALVAGVAVSVSVAISLWSKTWFERARPDLWTPLTTEPTYSYPSSHASASMSLALVIILLLWQTKWRKTAIIVGAIYVILVGYSRMYLGVHYPTDVWGGWFVAAGCVLFLRAAIKKIPRHG